MNKRRKLNRKQATAWRCKRLANEWIAGVEANPPIKALLDYYAACCIHSVGLGRKTP